MKIKNLQSYPQQLLDGRVIGAAGTKESVREYDLSELESEDKKRVKRGWLEVVEEEDKSATDKAKTEIKPNVPPTSAGNSTGGNK